MLPMRNGSASAILIKIQRGARVCFGRRKEGGDTAATGWDTMRFAHPHDEPCVGITRSDGRSPKGASGRNEHAEKEKESW